MKKMIQQAAWAFIIFGGLMLLLSLSLAVGLGGTEVKISGFYYIISFLFIVIGVLAIKKSHLL